MLIYECVITLCQDLFYCSHQLNNEYQMFPFISNTALPYALNLINNHEVHVDFPCHYDDFQVLNSAGIFVTPASFVNPVNFALTRFNCIPERIDNKWNVESSSTQSRKENQPDEGWRKEIIGMQKAVCYIMSSQNKKITFPDYIDLGKHPSRCEVETYRIEFNILESQMYHTDLYLRAEDIDPKIQIFHPKIVPIPHSTMLRQLNFYGECIQILTNHFRHAIIPYPSSFYFAAPSKI